MKISRRNMLISAGLASAGAVPFVRAQNHEGHDMSKMSKMEMPTVSSPRSAPGKVRTLNGWTLPFRMNNGIKEFHLVAEEIEHEFAPGSKAICWGYNGSTPGPDHRSNRR